MTAQEYISTGKLELYVLGELNAVEKAEAEDMIRQFPAVKQEFEEIQKTFEAVARQTAIDAPVELRSSILSKAEAREKQPTILPDEVKASSTVPAYLVAASLALFLVASFFAWDYRSRWKETEAELNTLIAQNQEIAQNYNQVNDKLEQLESSLNIMNDLAFQRIQLSGTDNAPNARAQVYWNPESADVYLSIQNLKTLSQEKQYQLWAIIDGKPVDAGLFTGLESGALVKMKPIAAGAAAFAVTIESQGGSESPTLETMQVYGEYNAGT